MPQVQAGSAPGSRRTIAYLDHAAGLLVDRAANSPELVCLIARYRDRVAGKELERALEELRELGDRYACPRGYWLFLRQAAVTMRLVGTLSWFDRRLRDGPGATPRGEGHP